MIKVLLSLQVGGLSLSSYHIILLVGTTGMFLCAHRRRKLFSLSSWQCGLFTLFLTGIGVVGAMLLFLLESGFWGGISFFGSVFLIPLAMPLIGKLFKLKYGQTLDVCGPCVAIMISCLRVNCFISGCCGGWIMHIGEFAFAWPTQALDSIGDVAICIWLLMFESNNKAKSLLYPLFMVSYGAMRFFLEFLRDTPKDWIAMSHGQWFALLAVLIGVVWIILKNKRDRCV